MEKFCFEKAGKFVGRGGTRSREARFPSPHPTPPGTPLCYALECVNLSAQSCMLLYWQCQAEPIFVSSDGKAARAAGLFPGIWQIGGVLRYVHHTPIGTIPTQPTAKNTESFSIHCNIPQRRTATCPERGSVRGKSGLRNSERLSPSQTCPRQSVPPKGKEPHCPKCPP